MKTSNILTRLSVAVMLLTMGYCAISCNKDDDTSNAETPAVQSEVLVLFSIAGLGDGSYNDQILRGIKLMENEHSQGMAIRFITPANLEEVESVCTSWWENVDKTDEKGRLPRRLLVLASSDYVDIARRVFANAEMNINRCVLAFEAEDNGDETEQIRTFGISMYGASWLAGRTARELGCKHPLVLLGNGQDNTIYDARDGFVEGFGQSEDGLSAVTEALADNFSGYGLPTELYKKMHDYDGQYDFIYAMAGGSNMGAYRYLRENPECGIYTAGMDTDKSAYSTLIVGSMVKRIDLVLYDHLTNWYHQKDLPRYQFYGLESGYINWQIADRYPQLKAGVDANWQTAIKKEKEYGEK